MKKIKYEYKLIDGNWTKNPVAYCKAKKASLTEGLINTHGCRRKKCMHLNEDASLFE